MLEKAIEAAAKIGTATPPHVACRGRYPRFQRPVSSDAFRDFCEAAEAFSSSRPSPPTPWPLSDEEMQMALACEHSLSDFTRIGSEEIRAIGESVANVLLGRTPNAQDLRSQKMITMIDHGVIITIMS